MIDNQQAAIFKSTQDFIKNKEKILQYIKYAKNWQVASVMCLIQQWHVMYYLS